MNDYLFAKVDKMVRVQIYLKNLSKNLFQAEPTSKNGLNTAFKPFFRINKQAERDLKYHF